MSSTSSVPMDSKSAKKRKTKAEATLAPPANGAESPALNGTAPSLSGEAGTESPYLKELSKQIRNIHKKLAASAKATSVVEANPDVDLDTLVAEKKLNADQKAQVLKKPQLQTQLAQLEEQQTHYKSFSQELEDRFSKEKAAIVEAHEAELEKVKEDALKSASSGDAAKVEDSLRVISHFLHTAAAKRASEEPDSEESRAYEGVLLQIYQGNSMALDTLRNLIEGSEEKIMDNEGVELDYSFAQLKVSASQGATTDAAEVPAEAEPVPEVAATESDPTIVNAGLTELEDTMTVPVTTNDESQEAIGTGAPEQSSTTAEAANSAAEASWDPQSSAITDTSAGGEDWVQVPRDPAETEAPNAPSGQQSTSNWADEAGAAAAEKEITTPVAPENDGFSEVRRERGGRGRGGRGRGFDGRGRGRGRGEFRGRGGGRGRGGQRGGATPAPAVATS